MTRPRILLVEDSPEITFLVRRCARTLDQDLVAFGEVGPAWEHLQSATVPDLILLDVNLPKESGLELCQRVRASPALAATKVALFSSWDRPDDIAEGLRAGIDFLVSKDLLIRPAAWAARLNEILVPPDNATRIATLETLKAQPPEKLVTALNLALQRPTIAQFDREVLAALLHRAVSAVGNRIAAPTVNDLHGWLLADSVTIRPDVAMDAATIPYLAALAQMILDLVGGLLGAADSAPFREGLMGTLSPHPQAPSRR